MRQSLSASYSHWRVPVRILARYRLHLDWFLRVLRSPSKTPPPRRTHHLHLSRISYNGTHTRSMEMGNAYKVWFENIKEWRPRRRWKDNRTIMNVSERGLDGVVWIYVSEYRDRWRALVHMVMILLVPRTLSGPSTQVMYRCICRTRKGAPCAVVAPAALIRPQGAGEARGLGAAGDGRATGRRPGAVAPLLSVLE
jgi:hypothetical protein